MRLDRFLGEALREQDVSREKVKRAIRDGGCLVDGAVCTDVSAKVGAGQSIELRMEAEPTSVQPEEGELEILYQDAWLAVLNKPAGMTVHPAPSCPDGTLVHRLVARFPSLRAQEGFRPGIVHRLDKDTSGLICVALTEEARMRLSEAFAAREIRKEYLALVQGVPAPAGTVDAPLGRHPTVKVKVAVVKNGKEARSEWRVLHKGQGYSLLGLISYLTAGVQEVRAWTITNGTKAPQAAGKIHTDFEKGFIRAEIVSFDDLMACGSMAAAKEKGLVRLEGKDYVMRDGDVVLFRFNV